MWRNTVKKLVFDVVNFGLIVLIVCSGFFTIENPQKAGATASSSTDYFLSTAFNNEFGQYEGPATLYTLKSTDGINFDLVSDNYVVNPPNTLRDPSVIFYNNKYWAVHTNEICDLNDEVTPCDGLNNFDLISSDDFINWTFVTHINTGDETIIESWAPQWFVDPNETGLDSLHVIVNLYDVDVDPIDYAFQPFELHPTNASFTSWSAPSAVTGTALPDDMIDTYTIIKNGVYYMFYKQPVSGDTVIEFVSSSSPLSGFDLENTRRTGDWAGWGVGDFEGAVALNIDEDTTRVYLDCNPGECPDTPASGKETIGIYYTDNSGDLSNPADWSALQLTNYEGGPYQHLDVIKGTLTANAGSDNTTASGVFTQNATVTDTASNVANATYAWSKVSGPGTLTFGSGNAEDTTISANVNGEYVVGLAVTNAFGYEAYDTMSLTWDSTAPVISMTTNPTTSSVDYADFAGTVTDDSTVSSLTANGVNIPINSGQFSFRISNLQSGVNSISLVTTDNLGNSRTLTLSVTYTLPVVEAAITESVTTSSSSSSTVQTSGLNSSSSEATSTTSDSAVIESIADGSSGDNFIFSNNSNPTIYTTWPTFSGVTTPNSTVVITIHSEDTIIGRTTSDSSGKWSYTVDRALAEGSHTIQIEVTTPEGKTLTSEKKNFSISSAKAKESSVTPTTAKNEAAEKDFLYWYLGAGVLFLLFIILFAAKRRKRVTEGL